MHIISAITLSAALLVVSAFPFPSKRQSGQYLSLPFTKSRQSRDAHLDRRAFSSSLANQVSRYVIQVDVGTPPVAIGVVLDTGSSDIWFYAPGACTNCTPSFFNPAHSSSLTPLSPDGEFQISYGSSPQGVSGFYASDILSVSGVSVRQTIGIATHAGAGTPPGGILGIGLPQDESAVIHKLGEFPGYLDTLKSCGIIKTRAYSVYLDDQLSVDPTPGTIIFGGYNPSKMIGKPVPFSIVEPAPDGYYRLDVFEPGIEVTFDGQTFSLPPASSSYTVNLDTGTAATYLPRTQFNALIAVLSAGVQVNVQEDPEGDVFYTVPCALADAKGGVTYDFSGHAGHVSIEVPWAELLFPDKGDTCLLGIFPQDNNIAEGVYGFGDTFLRSAYVIYNFDANTISLAQANHNASPGQIIEI